MPLCVALLLLLLLVVAVSADRVTDAFDAMLLGKQQSMARWSPDGLHASLLDPAYWRALRPDLHVAGLSHNGSKYPPMPGVDEASSTAMLAEMEASLLKEGYATLPPPAFDWGGVDPLQLAATVRWAKTFGSPAFVYVYDEFWWFWQRLTPVLDRLLGEGNWRCLPDMWAWHIEKSEGGWTPHRDKTEPTRLPDGRFKSLSFWISLNRATPDNGCMYLLPASRDPAYHNVSLRDNTQSNMRLQDIVAMPTEPGQVLLWSQEIYHWGGRHSGKDVEGRVSFSVEVQRADVQPYNNPLVDCAAGPPSLPARLRRIAQVIHQYTHIQKPDPVGLRWAHGVIGSQNPRAVLLEDWSTMEQYSKLAGAPAAGAAFGLSPTGMSGPDAAQSQLTAELDKLGLEPNGAQSAGAAAAAAVPWAPEGCRTPHSVVAQDTGTELRFCCDTLLLRGACIGAYDGEYTRAAADVGGRGHWERPEARECTEDGATCSHPHLYYHDSIGAAEKAAGLPGAFARHAWLLDSDTVHSSAFAAIGPYDQPMPPIGTSPSWVGHCDGKWQPMNVTIKCGQLIER